jgi:hypothetical protein
LPAVSTGHRTPRCVSLLYRCLCSCKPALQFFPSRISFLFRQPENVKGLHPTAADSSRAGTRIVIAARIRKQFDWVADYAVSVIASCFCNSTTRRQQWLTCFGFRAEPVPAIPCRF